jgi:hypothetical protein
VSPNIEDNIPVYLRKGTDAFVNVDIFVWRDIDATSKFAIIQLFTNIEIHNNNKNQVKVLLAKISTILKEKNEHKDNAINTGLEISQTLAGTSNYFVSILIHLL